MKQQCHLSFIYLSWVIFVGGLVFYLAKGDYPQTVLWLVSVPLLLWAYVRFFPSISRYIGYGSVEDQPAIHVAPAATNVTIYVGLGCPFCPIVKTRLQELQAKMGFALTAVDVTLKPDLLISKGIRALPMVEVGEKKLVGNATSEQLARLITEHVVPQPAS